MIAAGDLRERIRLQRHTSSTDTWDDMTAYVWAAVEHLGDERYRFRMRYRTDLLGQQDAQPAMRIKYRGRDLEVLDIREVEWHHEINIDAQAFHVEVQDISQKARRVDLWPHP